MRRPGWLGALIVLLAAGLFGSLGVLSRLAYAEGMAPFAFVAWRAGVGAIGLWLAVLVLRRSGGIRAQLHALGAPGRRWLLLAVLLATGLNLTAFLAFDNTTVALALLGFYTYPALVAAGAVLLGRERLDATRAAALVLALGGMVAVVLGGPPADAADAAVGAPARAGFLGIGLAIGAALFQTGFILTSRGYAALPTDLAMGAILGGSALVSLAVSAAADGLGALTMPLDRPPLLALLLYVGLFACALPSVLFLAGIRWIGGVRTGIVMLVEPVIGATLAAIVLAEGLEPVQIAGGATILIAALLVQRSSGEHADGAEPVHVAPAPGGP